MSNSKPEKIKGVLEEIIKRLKDNIVLKEDDMVSVWNKAVNKKIRAHTKVERFRDCKLIINVESSSWLFELDKKNKSKILKKLKATLGEDKIKDIKFKIGETKDVT